MIRKIEELSMNAFPSRDTLFYDGWVIRLSGGSARRVNSVYPLYRSEIPLEEKITHCEEIFLRSGLKKVFKLTDQETCSGLEPLLRDRGYHEEARTIIMTMDLRNFRYSCKKEMECFEAFPEDWYDDLCRSDRRSENDRNMYEQAWRKVLQPTCYAGLVEEGKRIAFARGVMDSGYMGLYGIYVDGGFRRRGYGEMVTKFLLDYGREKGCAHAYLQVDSSNEKAVSLYKKIGFSEIYRYWYMVKD